MSIQRHNTFLFYVACDYCSYDEEIETDDFFEVVEKLKEDEWESVPQDDSSWKHKCPSCIEEDVEPEVYEVEI